MEPQSHWEDAWILFVEWNRVSAANNSAKAWDPDSGGDKTFGDVKLSPNGQEPPTHSAARTLVTSEMKTDVLGAGNVIDRIYKESEGWDFNSALADMGLQRIYSIDI